jgi:hypothetical protein
MNKICGNCQESKNIEEFRVCTDKRNKNKTILRYSCSWCKTCEKEKALEKYHVNRVVKIAQNKEYKKNNKDKINERRRQYTTEVMKDPVKRLVRDMKCLLSMKITKTVRSSVYLGTDTDIIRRWIEWNFDDNMNWDNRGVVWQIDHTLPVHSFDLTNQQHCMLCFNWKNLMPLDKLRNIHKGSLVLPYRVFHQERKLREFFKNNIINDSLTNYLKEYTDHFNNSYNKQSATRPNCGKLLRALTTTLFEKS